MGEPIKYRIDNCDMQRLLKTEVADAIKEQGFSPISLALLRMDKSENEGIRVSLIFVSSDKNGVVSVELKGPEEDIKKLKIITDKLERIGKNDTKN
ncbi:hypothetical protein COV61_01070 [Candidatus Micrarchaeota archaeon CG11_big_fil_rev_8_21_14_0_20_47_5]|nr:MAG: hypothetical protein AUJ17_01470 [Candidatus Micrarchaeota archaeon CG1_02_47_40]PIN84133.1 MAG: hypothetical protein COV61_01070 [Candidatus Micrarchaeota archaeon CG11_big_fil_rev_8_21_14_0_20_47_5]